MLHYTDRHRLPAETEEELGLVYHPNAASLVKVCDVVTINAPLHPETENLFDDELISTMKRGAYLVNTARGKICDPRRHRAGPRVRAARRVTRATSGSLSRPRATTPGGRCPTTG